MKYRCTGCGMACTMSLPKGSTPVLCPVDTEKTAVWCRVSSAPRNDNRMSRVQVERMRDSKTKPVVAVDEHGGRIRFKSITEASTTLGINSGGIARALKNNGYRAGGYGWMYVGRTKDETRLFIAAQNGLEEYLDVLADVDIERYRKIMEDEE